MQGSSAYAVPMYEFPGDRETLNNRASKKTDSEIRDYWNKKNVKTLDDRDAGIFDKEL